jgi:hypothetical protein
VARLVGCLTYLIIRLIIQASGRDPSGSVSTDDACNLSTSLAVDRLLDSSGA